MGRPVDKNDDGSLMSGSDLGNESESSDGNAKHQTGGFGGAVARILSKSVKESADPVLSLRCTRAMREAEDAASKKARAADRRAERRSKLAQQMVDPEPIALDQERMLRRVATKGVVALFNAIAKTQKTSSLGADYDKNDGLSKEDFLDMLHEETKRAPAQEGTSAKKEKRGNAGKKSCTLASRAGDSDQHWSVLRDDYMMDALAMQDWDQESEDGQHQ
jgi:hypothetical protein